MKTNTHAFLGCEQTFNSSDVVLFGAPFDGTTSFRPGTRFASTIVRNESYGLETYSPILDLDLEDYNIFDGGDLEFPLGNPRRVLDIINNFTHQVLQANKNPLMIGGEHLLTLGVIEKMNEMYEDLHIIHIDAHTDLRDEYLGEKLSHATVIRRCHDLVGDNKIFQFGLRSGMKEEFKFAAEHCNLALEANEFFKNMETLLEKPVYITIDLDVLDPSIFSGTGTPEPGGLTYKELQNIILEFKKLRNIVGCDIVELAPNYDASGVSSVVCAKVIREMLLIMASGINSK